MRNHSKSTRLVTDESKEEQNPEETPAQERFYLSMLLALAAVGDFEQYQELIQNYFPEQEQSDENPSFFKANLLRLRYLPDLVAQEHLQTAVEQVQKAIECFDALYNQLAQRSHQSVKTCSAGKGLCYLQMSLLKQKQDQTEEAQKDLEEAQKLFTKVGFDEGLRVAALIDQSATADQLEPIREESEICEQD